MITKPVKSGVYSAVDVTRASGGSKIQRIGSMRLSLTYVGMLNRPTAPRSRGSLAAAYRRSWDPSAWPMSSTQDRMSTSGSSASLVANVCRIRWG